MVIHMSQKEQSTPAWCKSADIFNSNLSQQHKTDVLPMNNSIRLSCVFRTRAAEVTEVLIGLLVSLLVGMLEPEEEEGFRSCTLLL